MVRTYFGEPRKIPKCIEDVGDKIYLGPEQVLYEVVKIDLMTTEVS